MHDWNDTRTVPFVVAVVVVARVTARTRAGLTGSTLIPIKQILTSEHFCLSEAF